MSSTTLGVIFGNKDFFPDLLLTEARKDIVDLKVKCDTCHAGRGGYQRYRQYE